MLVGLGVGVVAVAVALVLHVFAIDRGLVSKVILWTSVLWLVACLIEPFLWLVGVWRGKSPLGTHTRDRP